MVALLGHGKEVKIIMATTTTTSPGLFELLAQDPKDAQLTRDLQMAKMTPSERAYVSGAQAGRAIGQGLGSLFGVEVGDPLVQKATQLRTLATNYDLTTSAGMDAYAQEVFKIDPKVGGLALEQAQNMRKAEAAAAKDYAAAQKDIKEYTTKEEQMNARVAMLQDAGFSEVQAKGIASNDTAFSKTVESKNIPTPVDYATAARALNLPAKPFVKDYSAEEMKAIEAKVVQMKKDVAKAGATVVSTVNKGQDAFAVERAKIQSARLEEARKEATSSKNSLTTLDQMEQQTQGNLITGPLAGSVIGAGQFLASVGALSPEAAKTLSSSEAYDKNAKDLVMQELNGKLGAQISDADRKFIEARIPQLVNSPKARKEIIAKLKELHKKRIDFYKRAQKHANKYGNLNDFDEFEEGSLGTIANPIVLD